MSTCNRPIQMDDQPSSWLFLTQVVTEIEGPSLGCFKIRVKAGDRVVFLLWAGLPFWSRFMLRILLSFRYVF
jgi:hypothetical protein